MTMTIEFSIGGIIARTQDAQALADMHAEYTYTYIICTYNSGTFSHPYYVISMREVCVHGCVNVHRTANECTLAYAHNYPIFTLVQANVV